MGQQVWTKIGLVDEDLLNVSDAISTGENHRKIVTTWTLKQDMTSSEGSAVAGEMVREDVAGSIFRGPSSEATPGVLG